MTTQEMFERLSSLSIMKQQALYTAAKDAHEPERDSISIDEYLKRVYATLAASLLKLEG